MPTDALPVAAIVVGDRVRRDAPNIAQLTESIRAIGLLNPVVVNTRHELVAGFRRLTAVKRLGWETVPVRVVGTFDDALAAMRAERDENTCREPLTPMEIVELGRQIEAIEKPEAAKRKTAGKNQHSEPEGNFPQGSTGKTRDRVGEALGVSGKTYEKLKAVKANGVQELIDAVDAGEVSADAAAKLAKLPPEEQAEVVKQGPEKVREKAKEQEIARREHRPPPATPPRTARGLTFAHQAIELLDRIPADDPEREAAVSAVRVWLSENEST